MQCSFSHSMVHGCDGNICSSLPKPMCSTSKLQVWKSHLSESRRDVLDVFGHMLRGRWLVYHYNDHLHSFTNKVFFNGGSLY
jgi:hypothetical protein